ncbi:MAG: hypothetical protein NC086_09250 [Alistipes sp.]|nr:hypothetical protein [Alistipes sp.]
MKQFNFRIVGLVILAGLVAGSLFANIYCNDHVSELGVFQFDFIEKMQRMNVQGGDLFRYVLSVRLKWWLGIGVLALTSVNGVIVFLYPLAFGFSVGTVCSMTVMVYGIKGVLYFAYLCLAAQCFYLVSAVLELYAGALIWERRATAARGAAFVILSVVLAGAGAALETGLYIGFAGIFPNI